MNIMPKSFWFPPDDIHFLEPRIEGNKIICSDSSRWYFLPGKRFDVPMEIQGRLLLSHESRFNCGVRWDPGIKRPGGYCIFRKTTIANQGTGPGKTGIGPQTVVTDGSAHCQCIALVDCEIKDCGDFYDGFDPDAHGMIVGHTSNVTLSNVSIVRCAGNAIQCAHQPRNFANRGVFLSECTMGSCKQSAIGIKHADLFVASKCLLVDNWPHGKDPSDPGAGVNLSYHHENVYFLDTRIENSQFGFVLGDCEGESPVVILRSCFDLIRPSDHPVWDNPEKLSNTHSMRPGTCIVHRRHKRLIVIGAESSRCESFYRMDDGPMREELRESHLEACWHDGPRSTFVPGSANARVDAVNCWSTTESGENFFLESAFRVVRGRLRQKYEKQFEETISRMHAGAAAVEDLLAAQIGDFERASLDRALSDGVPIFGGSS